MNEALLDSADQCYGEESKKSRFFNYLSCSGAIRASLRYIFRNMRHEKRDTLVGITTMVALVMFGCICFIMFESSQAVFYYGAMNTVGDIDILVKSNGDIISSYFPEDKENLNKAEARMKDYQNKRFIDADFSNPYAEEPF